MNKVRMMERDGEIIIVSQDVGNQAFSYQWVENDPRRHTEDGSVLYYRVDLSELPPGISSADTEAAIEAAVATFNDVQCGRNIELVRVDEHLTGDLGFIQHHLGAGGSSVPRADITFAGWVPSAFFDDAGVPGSNAVALPLVYTSDNSELVLGVDVLEADDLADIDGDRKHDLFATEIYFNADSNYVVDDDELGNTLFYIDLQSIVLHELGHALGMDHFGSVKVILDENGQLVDLLVNQHSTPVMNTNNYFVSRELKGSDTASFCGLYGSWGVGGDAS